MLPLSPDMTLLDRMVLGVERVRDRLIRVSTALESAGVPYALAGGNAVAAWVATIDVAAVRNTQDVDVLLRREDLERAADALQRAGFIRRHTAGLELFLDGPDAKARDAVHVVIANERVRPDYAEPAPDVAAATRLGDSRVRVIDLESLVRMKLTSFRRKDQVHLLDMLEVGLIDRTWPTRLAPELGKRLQELIDSPES
ncbi:MAG: nucleotidyltransferase family protein [Phycisphaerales bacterium]|nr:nucleotidyltransferase family protein [Phycisphaerales bacterium]